MLAMPCLRSFHAMTTSYLQHLPQQRTASRPHSSQTGTTSHDLCYLSLSAITPHSLLCQMPLRLLVNCQENVVTHIGGRVVLDSAGRLSVAGGGGMLAGAALLLDSCVGVAAAALEAPDVSAAAALAKAWDAASAEACCGCWCCRMLPATRFEPQPTSLHLPMMPRQSRPHRGSASLRPILTEMHSADS